MFFCRFFGLLLSISCFMDLWNVSSVLFGGFGFHPDFVYFIVQLSFWICSLSFSFSIIVMKSMMLWLMVVLLLSFWSLLKNSTSFSLL